MLPPESTSPPRSADTAVRIDAAERAERSQHRHRSTQRQDYEQYEQDLQQLARYERCAEDDLAMVDGLDTWQPTAYEQHYLPGMRLAGIRDKSHVTLQNVADLHIHTHYSDGDQLERVLEFAAAARLDAIAITDHDVIGGALEARRLVHERRLPFAVIPGVEVSSRDGHIGALFVTKVIEPDLSAADTVAAIHAAGGLAVAHHPFAPPLLEKLLRVKLGCGELVHTVDFDAIECTNAVPGYGRKYNIEAYEALARRKVRIGMTGSSDAHNASLIGKGTTYYAGNEGLLSARTALQHGFIHGAEGYWRFAEKMRYRLMLMKAIWNNLRRGGARSSVN